MADSKPTEFGKYWLVQRLAAGGMAEIYKARFTVGGGIEKTCVIKRILPHLSTNTQFITMFHDEARVTVRLSHTNIAQVFDFGQVADSHFLAMEYVQGQDLQSILRRLRDHNDRLHPAISLYVASETAKGLHYAHTRKNDKGVPLGIIHRDVSPANILISYEGEVKIIDFGIAKATSQTDNTQTGIIKGKASYMAPEYLLGTKELDGRADVFALGAVLWEALVGEKLFQGENEMEIIARIPQMTIEPPSSLNASLNQEIDQVVLRALMRDPAERYQTANDFHRDLVKLMGRLGLLFTSVDVGEFIQTLFSRELEAELVRDREISKTMIKWNIQVDEPTSLTPPPVSPPTEESTPGNLPQTRATGLPDTPMDITRDIEQTLAAPPGAIPDALPATELSAAAKRLAQRNIKAGVLKPKRVRRAGLISKIAFGLFVAAVLAALFVLLAPRMGIELPF